MSALGWLTTPRAILLGAFVIGAFAYAGLRDRSTPPPLTVTPATPAAPSTPLGTAATGAAAQSVAVTPAVVSAEPAPSVAPLRDRAALEVAVGKALAEHLPSIKQACWKGRPGEARVRLMMNVSFDPTGAQIARGLSEPRLPDHQRVWLAGLGQCITEKLPPLSIDPPGANVQVEIPIDFP